VGQITGFGATLALEKDWVPILCRGHEQLLASVNSNMRRIDLICKLIAPALFGVIIQYLDLDRREKIFYGSLGVLVWNILGLFLEYSSMRLLYTSNPILANMALPADTRQSQKRPAAVECDLKSNLMETAGQSGNINSMTSGSGKCPESGLINSEQRSAYIKRESFCTTVWKAFGHYRQSVMFWASIGFCMLFFSVMDTGALIFAYLKSQGIPYSYLGYGKGIGALFGILGTFLTESLHNVCGLRLELIGLLTLWLFWFCVAPSAVQFIAEIFFDEDIFSGEKNVDDAYVILGCMIVARCGLWAFDLAENQMMQERVSQKVRAQVNGVQMSVSEGFTILMSAFAMFYSHTSDFYILLLTTVGMIFGACIVYTLWFCCPCCRRGRGMSASRSNNSGRTDQSMRFSETSATRPSRYLT